MTTISLLSSRLIRFQWFSGPLNSRSFFQSPCPHSELERSNSLLHLVEKRKCVLSLSVQGEYTKGGPLFSFKMTFLKSSKHQHYDCSRFSLMILYNGLNVFNGPFPASFSFIIVFLYSTITEKFSSQRHSNSDRQSSRRERLPLYHHHCP